MGLIRFILAISVLIAHCPLGLLRAPVNPNLAVQCFYVISGFYIQLIIREKFPAQERGWEWDFYKSRIARIFPVYYLFTIPMFILFGSVFLTEHWRTHDVLGISGFLYANIFLAPLDFHYIFTISLAFFGFYIPHPHELFINPPTWTLALELTFYLLAPWLLRQSSRLLVTIGTILAVARVECMRWEDSNPKVFHELFPDGLNHFIGYFPFELSLFLAGSLGYRFYAAALWSRGKKGRGGFIERIRETPVNGFLYAVAGVIWLAFLWYLLEGWGRFPDHIGPLVLPPAYWMVIIVTVLVLPFVFHFTRFIKWDRYIGELSYPVYLSHFLVLKLVDKYLSVPTHYVSMAVLAITFLLSVAAWRLVEVPMTLWRHRRFESRSEEDGQKEKPKSCTNARPAEVSARRGN